MSRYIHIEKITDEEIWAGRTECPSCKHVQDFYLCKDKFCVSALGLIPVISIVTGKYLICDICGYRKDLSRKEYKNVKKQQMEMLKNKEIPAEIVERGFALSTFEIVFGIIQTIIFGLLTLFMGYVEFTMIQDMLEGKDMLGAFVLGFLITAFLAYLCVKPWYRIIFKSKINKLYR